MNDQRHNLQRVIHAAAAGHPAAIRAQELEATKRARRIAETDRDSDGLRVSAARAQTHEAALEAAFDDIANGVVMLNRAGAPRQLRRLKVCAEVFGLAGERERGGPIIGRAPMTIAQPRVSRVTVLSCLVAIFIFESVPSDGGVMGFVDANHGVRLRCNAQHSAALFISASAGSNVDASVSMFTTFSGPSRLTMPGGRTDSRR